MNGVMIGLLLLHIVSAVIWVGGMVFAHFMLRPAALALDPPVRLSLFRGVFARFFPIVWVLIVVLLGSGFGMISVGFGGFAHLPSFVNIMLGLGIVMMLAFGHLYFAPWKRMKRALDRGDLAAAGKALGQIRMIVIFNTYLGLIVVVIGATGRYWG
ncbi:MAG: CopD family protein [Stellaceae bacterium]